MQPQGGAAAGGTEAEAARSLHSLQVTFDPSDNEQQVGISRILRSPG